MVFIWQYSRSLDYYIHQMAYHIIIKFYNLIADFFLAMRLQHFFKVLTSRLFMLIWPFLSKTKFPICLLCREISKNDLWALMSSCSFTIPIKSESKRMSVNLTWISAFFLKIVKAVIIIKEHITRMKRD